MKLSCGAPWRQLAQFYRSVHQVSWLQVTETECTWSISMISSSYFYTSRDKALVLSVVLGRKPIACALQNIKSHRHWFLWVYLYVQALAIFKRSQQIYL